MEIVAFNWKPFQKNTLQGFVDLHFTTVEIVVKGVCVHEKNGKRWLSPPARPIRLENGNNGWTNVIDFVTERAKHAFQHRGLEALDKLTREREALRAALER